MQKDMEINKAVRGYELALNQEPESISILTNLALLYCDLGEYQKAVQCSDKAIELQSSSHLTWFARGVAQIKLNRINDGINSYKKTLEINTDFYPAYLEIASVLFKNASDDEQIINATNYSLLSLKYYLNSTNFGEKIDPKVIFPIFRLKHDLEQARYLVDNNLSTPISKIFIKQVSGIIANKSRLSNGDVQLSQNENFIIQKYMKKIQVLESAKFEYHLNPLLDWESIEDNYFKSADKIIYIDEFLTQDVLEWLIKFSLESKIWLREYKMCYLGAFADTGFISQVHLNIAKELRIKLPNIIGKLNLEQLWGFKYDSKLGGG
jgi:tetratricopeptide (TPR) repeat protein